MIQEHDLFSVDDTCFQLNNTVVRMVTQSFEVSLLSFALPNTTMALIHTFANNSGREQWQVVQGAIASPDKLLKEETHLNKLHITGKEIYRRVRLISVLTKCFGFAIFAKLPKFRPFLGVRKNNKRMKHKHAIYHFTARDLEKMNICFTKYSNLANLRRLL